MLNQTNIRRNNNKFFLLQLLKEKDDYHLWFRWGRVGLKVFNFFLAFFNFKYFLGTN